MRSWSSVDDERLWRLWQSVAGAVHWYAAGNRTQLDKSIRAVADVLSSLSLSLSLLELDRGELAVDRGIRERKAMQEVEPFDYGA